MPAGACCSSGPGPAPAASCSSAARHASRPGLRRRRCGGSGPVHRTPAARAARCRGHDPPAAQHGPAGASCPSGCAGAPGRAAAAPARKAAGARRPGWWPASHADRQSSRHG
ncbi:hypothetical protein G6F61_014148 [Rhizopus arrhizus]|nr:hypothetical protein G6F61_014148 [Rhizopus arrhizus]